MASFAEIDENNIVLQVVKISNEEIVGIDGKTEEQAGLERCAQLWPDRRWVQCSYSAKIGKNYPGPGYIWRADLDGFIPPQPAGDDFVWTLNEQTCRWEGTPKQ